MTKERYLTADEVAAYLKVGRETVYRVLPQSSVGVQSLTHRHATVWTVI